MSKFVRSLDIARARQTVQKTGQNEDRGSLSIDTVTVNDHK